MRVLRFSIFAVRYMRDATVDLAGLSVLGARNTKVSPTRCWICQSVAKVTSSWCRKAEMLKKCGFQKMFEGPK